MDLPSQIHVFNRNGTYYFRRRIPKETKDRKEAERLARIEGVKLDHEFQQHRIHLVAHSGGQLSDEDIQHICALWIAEGLEEDEETRMEGLTDRDYRKLSESLNIADAGSRYELAKGDTEFIEWEMEDFLRVPRL
jgi:hypothetical protein